MKKDLIFAPALIVIAALLFVLKLTGMKQENLMPMYEGLKMEIGNIPKDYVPRDSERGLRMDAYIKEHNL